MPKLELAFAAALMFAINGCGNSGSNRGKTPAKPETKEAIPVAAEKKPETHEPAPTVALVIQVFQEDTDMGAAAVINRLDDTGTAHYVTDVDNSGIANISMPCMPGDRFQPEPKASVFLRVAPQPCASKLTFRLYSAQSTRELIILAQNDENAGNFAFAQEKFSLAAERLQISQPLEAEQMKVHASRNAGKILGVQHPTTTVNGKEMVAPQTVEKLKLYQQQANIPATGIIDRKTREALLKSRPNVGK
jgi:Putative peptidoglycan binding domain